MNINKTIMTVLLTGSLIANSSDATPAAAATCPQEELIKTIAVSRGYEITNCEVQAIKTAAEYSVKTTRLGLATLLSILTDDHINLITRSTATADARK